MVRGKKKKTPFLQIGYLQCVVPLSLFFNPLLFFIFDWVFFGCFLWSLSVVFSAIFGYIKVYWSVFTSFRLVSTVFVCFHLFFGYFQVFLGERSYLFRVRNLLARETSSHHLPLFSISPTIVHISSLYFGCLWVFSSKKSYPFSISNMHECSPLHIPCPSYFIFSLGALRQRFWVRNPLV